MLREEEFTKSFSTNRSQDVEKRPVLGIFHREGGGHAVMAQITFL